MGKEDWGIEGGEMNCHGCGGVVGQDCFNPQECEQITRSMAEEYQRQQATHCHSHESEPVQITVDNAEDRIEEAINTILVCWDEWDADAQQDAQQAQSSEAYLEAMECQLRAVLEGMVFDRPK